MRSFNDNDKYNRTKSFQTENFPNIKSIYNNHNFQSSENDKKLEKSNLSIQQNYPKIESSEELVLLSNAKLNIINILNTCVSEGLYNKSSIINNHNHNCNNNSKSNKRKESKDMNKNKLFKNNNQIKSEKAKDFELHKKRMSNYIRINSNKNLLGLDPSNKKLKRLSSNISEISFNLRRKSNNNFKNKYSESELFSNGSKNLSLNKFSKYYSNLGIDNLCLKSYKNRSHIRPLQRSFSNNKLKTFKLDQSVASIHSKIKVMNSKKKDKNLNIFEALSDKEVFKLNQNINNEINSIQLKKKISHLKRKIKQKYSNKNNIKYKSDGEGSPILSLRERKSNHIIDNLLNNTKNLNLNNSYKSNQIKKISIKTNINSDIKLVKTKEENKNRYIIRKNCLYDSFDDEEYQEEFIGYYISPNSKCIKIFDILIFISSTFYFIFIPYFLSKNYFLTIKINSYKAILMIIDVIYIVDVILNFFRAYHNFEDHLVRKKRKIIIHYFKTWFLLDLVQAFPYFSFLQLLEKKQLNKYAQINPLLYILLLLKVIKFYKMFNNNTTISNISQILSKNETIDNHGNVIFMVFIFLCFLNMNACVFIFLGLNSYPNWIIKLNMGDVSYLNVYLTSAYFIIVTITTVGYGDITGDSIPEISFQIFLLILGTIAYSFIISFFSNYIIKSNQKSMIFEKKVDILNEIKLNHPNMKDSIYYEVLRTLKNEQLYERKDKHILFDCLPYSLKNEMIMEMYKQIIKNFIFFKEIDNSDFITKVSTSLKPLIAFKGDILIQEGDFVKEIFFVKFGVVGLNICIDLEHIDNSIKKFFGKNEIGKLDVNYLKSEFLKNRNNSKTSTKNLDTFLINKTEALNSDSESENNCENIEDIKIIEIRKNEHFGDALMFLNERSPLIAKVRTKNAELLMLRKMEAIEIYSVYPNIWKRINKKSLYNMEQIYLKIKKLIIEVSKRYNIKIVKSCIYQDSDKKFLKSLKIKKKIKSLSEVKTDTKMNEEMKKKKVDSRQDISEKDENEINLKLNSKRNIIQNKENWQKPAICQVITFNQDIQDNIKNGKDSNEEEEAILNNESSKPNIKLIQTENDDKENKKLLISKTVEQRNIKFTNSIVHNESFRIICEKESFQDKEKNNTNNNNNSIDKLNMTIQRQSFLIQSRALTIGKDSCGSLKVNKSFKESDSDNSEYINVNEDSSNSINVKNKKPLNSSFSKKEKVLYSFFINLSSTKENSLLFSSSYENINKISNNMYINNFNLQKKIKSIITFELNNKESDKSITKQSSQYLHLATSIPNIHINSNKDNINPEFIGSLVEKPKLKHSNSTKKFSLHSKTIKNEFINLKSDKSISGVKNENRSSVFALRNNSKFKVGIDSPNKAKRKISKSKLVKVKKKLSVITRNIQNTNNIINNPNEFYMNFFNDIIKNKSFAIKKDDDKEKNKEQNLSNNSNSLSSQK